MTLRIGTVPDTHPYLDAVLPLSVRHMRFGPDIGWDPSPLLDASTRPACLDEIDVLHVHFGYEGVTATQLENFVTDVRRAGVRLVVTVHDLRNPHDRDRASHDSHLGILVGAADAVLTLTPGAAEEITRRWTRPVTVIGHPSLLSHPAPRRGQASWRTVGIHLKSLRANVVDPIPLIQAAAQGTREAGALLRVDAHSASALLTDLTEAADGAIELHVHERFSDDDLIAYLASLDVSVLPYRFGTHSGWLELCRDLGVAVIAPDCGYYAQQWPSTHTYSNNEHTGLDGPSLRRAVLNALLQPRLAPADRGDRLAQREHIRAAHADLYARVAQSVAAR